MTQEHVENLLQQIKEIVKYNMIKYNIYYNEILPQYTDNSFIVELITPDVFNEKDKFVLQINFSDKLISAYHTRNNIYEYYPLDYNEICFIQTLFKWWYN